MRRFTLVLLTLSLLVFLPGCPDKPQGPATGPKVYAETRPAGQQFAAGSPQQAVVDFHDALQSGVVANAGPLMAFDLETNAQQRRATIEKLKVVSEQMASDAYDFRVVDTKEDKDCAIVIVQETVIRGAKPAKPSLADFHLIKQSGLWKVLPRMISAQGARLAPEQSEAFGRLSQWYKSTKPGWVTKLQGA